MALKTLVLLFVVALALTVLGQPAGAHYDPWAKERAAIAKQYEAKMKQLAAENAELKKELEESRRHARATEKQLDEYKLRLQHLRNAIALRNKRHDRLSEKKEAVCTKSAKSVPAVESAAVSDVPTTLAQKPAPVQAGSTETAGKPDTSSTVGRFRTFDRARRAVQRLLLAMCCPPWVSAAARSDSGNADREITKPVAEKIIPGLESLRRRIKELGTRLKGAVEKRPVPQKVESKKHFPAPQAPRGLREKLLEGLREAFRSELRKRLDALRRHLEGRIETGTRRSSWF
jgi:hypothetical protein